MVQRFQKFQLESHLEIHLERHLDCHLDSHLDCHLWKVQQIPKLTFIDCFSPSKIRERKTTNSGIQDLTVCE